VSCNARENSQDLTIVKNQKQHLKQLFIEWRNNEVAQGHLWASDSCYLGWIADHGFDGMIEDMGNTRQLRVQLFVRRH
jgi:hypothetical protein